VTQLLSTEQAHSSSVSLSNKGIPAAQKPRETHDRQNAEFSRKNLATQTPSRYQATFDPQSFDPQSVPPRFYRRVVLEDKDHRGCEAGMRAIRSQLLSSLAPWTAIEFRDALVGVTWLLARFEQERTNERTQNNERTNERTNKRQRTNERPNE